jgi:queuine tRNA-ribosyltransferase subunit QTRTD1
VYKKLDADKISELKAAHGQQPNEKPEMRDVIDDEALLGLMSMGESEVFADPITQMNTLKLEDDSKS